MMAVMTPMMVGQASSVMLFIRSRKGVGIALAARSFIRI
jgi:hypothetical protein